MDANVISFREHIPDWTIVKNTRYYYYKITNKNGEDVIVVQIAGLIARRIVCETLENDDLNQGDRIGMIRFGSRADLYFENYKPLVKLEQRAVAGETLIARKV